MPLLRALPDVWKGSSDHHAPELSRDFLAAALHHHLDVSVHHHLAERKRQRLLMIYRADWRHLSWMTFCWISGCGERVPREDDLGLCPRHVTELQMGSVKDVVGTEVRGG